MADSSQGTERPSSAPESAHPVPVDPERAVRFVWGPGDLKDIKPGKPASVPGQPGSVQQSK